MLRCRVPPGGGKIDCDLYTGGVDSLQSDFEGNSITADKAGGIFKSRPQFQKFLKLTEEVPPGLKLLVCSNSLTQLPMERKTIQGQLLPKQRDVTLPLFIKFA